MKKIIFIAILLIGLGAAWTLYLEHRNKRFVDSLPKGAAPQQSANAAEAPAIGDKHNQEGPVDSVPAEIAAENARVWHEHAGPHPQSQADTPDEVKPPTDTSLAENPTQTSSDSNPVPPEVIEDSKQDLEWHRAFNSWDAKYEALYAERRKLSQELQTLVSFTSEEIERSGGNDAYFAKLDAWEEKLKVWEKKKKELIQEKPKRPTPTHTH